MNYWVLWKKVMKQNTEDELERLIKEYFTKKKICIFLVKGGILYGKGIYQMSHKEKD